MNILFVFYVPSGGVETLNRQRCNALKKYNIHGHCLYYEKRRDLVNDHGTPTYITNDDNEIKKIVEDGDYKAIVVVSDFQALPRLRKMGYKGKIIIEIQGYGPKDVARTALISAISHVRKHADGFLNPKTPHIVQIIDTFYPNFPQFSFNNCFDTSNFSYRALPKETEPVIAWIGRIDDNKNWREFLELGRQLINQFNSNIKFQMFCDPTIGDPKERVEFEQLVKEFNTEVKSKVKNGVEQEAITLHLNVPNSQMADHFSVIGDSGGFLCSTSKVEGAPYSLLEAMSCKCPVLTTDSDGVRSSIIHNYTGKYYTLGNIQEGVNQAIELMTNHPLRERIRINSLEHVKHHFSPDLYCRNFINMLLSLGVNYSKPLHKPE